MAKMIIRLLLLIIVVLAGVLLVRDDPGQLMLRYHDYSVETTLAFAVLILVLLVVTMHYSFRFLRGLWHLPGSIKNLSQNRRYDKSRRQLNQGLIDLAEGRFEQAEHNRPKSSPPAPHPAGQREGPQPRRATAHAYRGPRPV